MWRAAIPITPPKRHILHLGEAKLGDRLTGTLQVLQRR